MEACLIKVPSSNEAPGLENSDFDSMIVSVVAKGGINGGFEKQDICTYLGFR